MQSKFRSILTCVFLVILFSNVSNSYPWSLQQGQLKEDFEQASKASYSGGESSFRTGRWLLNDALIGNSIQDVKNGGQSVRIRNTGKLAMLFDAAPCSSVTVSYAVYGHDGPSDWGLWISYDGGKTYKSLKNIVSASTVNLRTATFNTGAGSFRLEVRKVGGGSNRLNIDDIIFNSASKSAGPVAARIPSGDRTDKVSQVPGTENTGLLPGNPSNARHNMADPDNYLIDQGYYTESYNRSRSTPNWVSWHIGKADLGSADRLDDFRADVTLPSGWYQVDNDDYRGSGFDKGHNCPSADRTSSSVANSATFLMDNIISQAPNNNQHTWEHLEAYCRDQVKKGNEAYVIMGNYGSGGTGRNGYARSIGHGRINVPARIWKVVIILPEGDHDLQRINAGTRIIAIDTPNDNQVTSNWMDYLCTVRDIEKATGYDLLSALPKALQDILETHKFKGGD